MSKNMFNSVRQVDLAKAWSVSRSLICQYVREGMPLDSVEAAEGWRLRVKGKGGKVAGGDGGMALESNNSADKGSAPGFAADGSLVDRVRETEMEIWRHLQTATGFEERRNLLRLHKEAAATRVKVEGEQMELDMKSGRLVDFEESKAFVRGALASLVVGLRGMGTRLSVKCNPGRPEMAAKAIEEEVQRLLVDLQEALK